jgi:uncharacterized surface protein with fasciclin (FAS1) repeats
VTVLVDRLLCALAVAVVCAGATACADAGAPAGDRAVTVGAPSASSRAAPPQPSRETSGLPLFEALETHGATTMAHLVRAAGLEERLSASGPVTVIAPDDDAFAAFAATELARLFARDERAQAFVLDHALAGRVPREALSDGLLTETLYFPAGLREASHRLAWAVHDGALEVEGARVTAVLEAAAATVYLVDRPLPATPSAWARPARVSPGERVTIVCRWVDPDGAPIAGARCTFGWHFGAWMPHDEALTDAHGVARCTRLIPSRSAGERVLVTVTTHGPRPARTVVATFAVR